MKQLFRRLLWIFRRAEFERDLEEEMRHHLAMKAADSDERKSAAAFGSVALLKEDSRGAWRFALAGNLALDIRYGLRAIRSNLLFTCMAVLSLALGIGANTAIYSFLHAILLQSLPVRSPAELVTFLWRSRGNSPVIHGLNGTSYAYGANGSQSPNFPYPAWEMLRANSPLTSSLFAYAPEYQMNVMARDQAEVVRAMYISGNFYSGLGVAPALGRLITDEDDKPGAPHVAVIPFQYWRTRFISDPSAVGQSILLNRIPFTVIGVSAPGFFGIDDSMDPAIFIPLHARPLFSRDPRNEEKARFSDKNFYWVEMMGRLRPGVSIEQARSVLGAMFRRYAENTAVNAREKAALPEFWAEPGGAGRDGLRREYGKTLYVLMSMVGLILMIACANIANLLLARGTARSREIATRLSLGASRGRIIRQLLTESLLLSLAGGLAGIGVAMGGIRLLLWQLSSGREGLVIRAALDWPALEFAAGLAILCGIVFGLAPAIHATRGDLAPALKEARISSLQRHPRGRLGQVLVVAQVAMSLLLVTTAGLFLRTLANLHSISPGFNPEHLLIFSVNAGEAGYKNEALARFYAAVGDRLRGMPDVRSVAMSEFPLVAYYINSLKVSVSGEPADASRPRSTCLLRVSDSFFETMQIPLLSGRPLSARDLRDPRSVVVSAAFVKRFVPQRNAVGRTIRLEGMDEDLEIVGIARTALYNNLKEEPQAVVYMPYTANPKNLRGMWFEVRTGGDPLHLASSVRRIVHEMAPAAPVTNLKTQMAQIDETISRERTFADLCTCFAALALVIACVGLYGTTAYAVARRTSEIGIRMALGAERAAIIWMMLRDVVVLAVIGLVFGIALAWQGTHLVSSFLYGVKPQDPVAICGAAAILLASVIVAAYAPARRAARIDPIAALRNE